MTTMVTVELGRAAPPWRAVGEDYRGRVLHLLTIGLIVVAETRSGPDWWCRVIAGPAPMTGDGHVRVSTSELAAGHTTMTVDADADPDGYAMAWQARVWMMWPGGPMATLARVLVEDARVGGGVDLVLTSATRRRVLNAAHLRSYGLASLLDRLVTSGLLTAAAAGTKDDADAHDLDDAVWYTLAIPPSRPTAGLP